MKKVIPTMRRGLLRLAAIDFVRTAIEEEADLMDFKQRPTLRILSGVFLISFSFALGWPAIAALAVVAIKLKEPLLAVIGGPLLYILSHLVFLTGMYLSGAKYSVIFCRWFCRVVVEKLLAWVPAESAD